MNGASRSRALLLVSVLAVLTFLELPATLYLGNLADFSFGLAPILRLLLVPALLLVVAAALGLRLASRSELTRFNSAVAALTLLVWIQSYLLVWDYGVLDGTPIDWQATAWRGWLDLSLWLAGLTAALAFARRLERPLALGAFAVVALQAATLVVNGLGQREALALKNSQSHSAGRLEPIAAFSAQRNVVEIVLDSFQADVFNDIVTAADGGGIRSALGGFTFFEENLGVFPATHLAMPVIVSGRPYRNDQPKRDYLEAAYSSGSILHAARAAGFDVDIAADSWVFDSLSKAGVDHGYQPGLLPPVQEAARLLDLALFRLVPRWIKPVVYNDQHWRVQHWLAPSELVQYPYFTHNAFLAEVASRLTVGRPKPVYKFFHLMTPHTPFVVEPDCSYAGGALVRVRETVTAQSRCSLAFVIGLLNRMKQAGVYDNSLIVLLGDHGGHVPPLRFRAGGTSAIGTPNEPAQHIIAMATPLLAIKPPGDTAAFRISGALTSTGDVPATIAALMGFGADLPSHSIWDDRRPRDGRRTYFNYLWQATDPVADYIKVIDEYSVSGSAYHTESWTPVATYYPPSP